MFSTKPDVTRKLEKFLIRESKIRSHFYFYRKHCRNLLLAYNEIQEHEKSYNCDKQELEVKKVQAIDILSLLR